MLASVLRQRGGLVRGALRAVSTAAHRFAHSDVPIIDADTVGIVSPNLVQTLRSASSSLELFETVSLKRKEFDAEHVMIALKRLFHLQKNENTAIPNKHILKNPDFEHLCRNLKHVARTLNVNDIIESMKILNYVGVPPNSEISMTLLHLVRHQINDISLGQIVFLDFLMGKFDSTPLVEALRIALPMLMQIQLGTKMDHENPSQLTDLLQFATRNSLSEQARMNIISALTLHGTDLTLDEARSIVWSLTDLKTFSDTHERLLHNCMDVLCDSLARLPFDIVETTLTKMVVKYAQHRVAAFYDEEFYGRCAQYVIDKDVGFLNALYIQRKFNRINFVSIDLIEYITEKICASPELMTEATPTALLTYISAMSQSYYKPVAWDTLKPYLRRNAFVSGPPRPEKPWLRFVLELMALDVCDERQISELCEASFLKQHLQRTQNTLDMLQLLLLHQVVELLIPGYAGERLPAQLVEKAMHIQLQRQEMPLRPTVERIFGCVDRVHSGVVTRYGHFVDHVVVFDGAGKSVEVGEKVEAVRAESDEEDQHRNVLFEDIQPKKGERAVAIVTYPRSHYCLNLPRLKGMFQLRVRSLEALGVPVCVINADLWSELPDREKLDYVEREVRYKLAA